MRGFSILSLHCTMSEFWRFYHSMFCVDIYCVDIGVSAENTDCGSESLCASSHSAPLTCDSHRQNSESLLDQKPII